MHSSCIIAFVFLSTFYIFSLNPVFPTGDAGGLIVASQTLGLAHPPGYPLFSELGRLFIFLPFGNIGLRVGLLPNVFAVLSLLMVFIIIKKIQQLLTVSEEKSFLKNIIPLIAVLSLGLSYSFYFQSTMTKFYPINAFFVLLLFYMALLVIEKGFDKRLMFISAFVLGLITGLHHTGLFMIIPLFILGLFYKILFFRYLPISLIFFTLGFLVNLHLYIRSIKDSFSAAHKASNVEGFVNILLRKFYGESSSLDTVSVAFYDLTGYLNGTKNFIYLIDSNFGYASLLFIILALIYFYSKNKKFFLFFIVTFLLYSIVLAKMTMSGKERDFASLYVVGNQYFIPAFCLYAILFATGIGVFAIFLKNHKFYLLSRVFPIMFLILPLIFLPMRFNQSFQFNNWVPYYHAKDLLSILPMYSVISTYGDNHTFELWYMKLIGRYRDDVCHITSHYYNDVSWRMEGCKPRNIYERFHRDFYSGNLDEIFSKKLFYSTVALSDEHPFNEFIRYEPYTFIFLYQSKNIIGEDENSFLKEMNLLAEKFLTPQVCISHKTDDPFTFEMCNFFSNSYLVLASHVKPKIVNEKIIVDASISYGKFKAPLKLNLSIGEENYHYIALYQTIRNYNDYRRCYLLE